MGMLGVTGRVALAKNGVAADVTPNAVNWQNADSGTSTAESVAQTITGINTSINVYWECYYCGDGLSIAYNKNGAGWVSISDLVNISISNNDTLNWQGQGSGGIQIILIKNASDSNALLDEILFEVLVGL